jgi:hypothetical protein
MIIMKPPCSYFPSLLYIRRKLTSITYASNASQTRYKRLRINWSMPRSCKEFLTTIGIYGLQSKALEQKIHTGDQKNPYHL